MKLKRYLGVIATGLLIFGSAGAQAETLQQAVKHTLASNPDVKSSYYSWKALTKEITQAKSGFAPTLDYTGGIGTYETYDPDRTSSTPKEHILSLRQNLFNGYATVNEVKRQEARVESAAYALRTTSEDSALKVAKAYLDVLRHTELNELAKENLLIHQRIFDQIKLRSESGVDYRANLDQVKGRLALAQSNRVVTEINLIDAQTSYQAVVGRLPEDLSTPKALIDALPATMEEAQEAAVDSHPTLKSAEADVTARRAQDEVAKSAFLPTVELEVDKGWKEDVSPYAGWRDDLTTMLRLRFNLFNGWHDKARKQETAELLREAREIQNHTHRQVIESLRLAWMSHKAMEDKISHLEEYVQSTATTAEAFSKQWGIGKRTMLDVLDTEAEVINAKKDLINTKYDGMYSECRILNSMGALVHALGLQWPGEEPPATDQASNDNATQPTPTAAQPAADENKNS